MSRSKTRPTDADGHREKNKARIRKVADFMIICEGDEEAGYIEKLNGMNKPGVWKGGPSVRITKADSLNNVSEKFSDEYQSGFYENVVVFCDTETPVPKGKRDNYYPQYEPMVEDIKRNWKEVSIPDTVFFANPNSMQVILLHFGFVKLTTNNKKANAPTVEKYTGVKDYDGKGEKISKLMEKLNEDNYKTMRENLKKIESDDFRCVSSSNVGRLFDRLEKPKKRR